jgi:hypothetical protein
MIVTPRRPLLASDSHAPTMLFAYHRKISNKSQLNLGERRRQRCRANPRRVSVYFPLKTKAALIRSPGHK